MGQKVNPIGFRLGYSKTWSSNWFSDRNNYKDCIYEDELIRNYLFKKVRFLSVSEIVIERPNNECNIKICTSRPGALVGKQGKDLNSFKEYISKNIRSGVTISLVEERNPEINANIVASFIAKGLLDRIYFKKLMKKSLQSILRGGAKGAKIVLSGRLGGAEIARKEKCQFGSMPLHTLRCDISYCSMPVRTSVGVIGVKVWINRGISKHLLEKSSFRLESKEDKKNAST